jgi:hypothetical protein
LGNVHTPKLTGCENVRDMSAYRVGALVDNNISNYKTVFEICTAAGDDVRLGVKKKRTNKIKHPHCIDANMFKDSISDDKGLGFSKFDFVLGQGSLLDRWPSYTPIEKQLVTSRNCYNVNHGLVDRLPEIKEPLSDATAAEWPCIVYVYIAQSIDAIPDWTINHLYIRLVIRQGYSDVDFKKLPRVLKKLANINNIHTVSLTMRYSPPMVESTSILSNAHTLDLSDRNDVGDVSGLGNVHTLALSKCENVWDVSALGNVHTLNLSFCLGVTDVSALGNVHDLDLSDCSGVTDVSALGRVHTLNLNCCRGVTDVSALGKVHTLDLSWCQGVRDVSALGNVHTLDLNGCRGVRDVSALGNVHNLNLRKCENVRDVSALGNVHSLDLTRCNGVTDVSALGNVHTLNLTDCYGVTDVSALGKTNMHTLNLTDCHIVKDVSALGKVHTLNLTDCYGVKDVSALSNVHSLNLRNYYYGVKEESARRSRITRAVFIRARQG